MSACGNRQRQRLFLILLTTLCLRLALMVFVPLQEVRLHPKMHVGMGQVSD